MDSPSGSYVLERWERDDAATDGERWSAQDRHEWLQHVATWYNGTKFHDAVVVTQKSALLYIHVIFAPITID